MGIYMEGSAGNLKRTVTIKNNKLENYRYGIYLRYMENVDIYKNEIINAATTNGPATQGMSLFHCDSMLNVRKNEIIMTAGTNNYGMDILTCITTYGGTKGQISNNMITVGGTGTSRGIYTNGTTNKNFYYNSMLTTGTNTTSSRAFYVNGPQSANPALNANFTVKNNIFMATVGKTIYNSVGGITSCDYNEYYVTAGTDIGYWDGTTVADLAALKTANSDDANSISSDPLFVSATDPYDLHIQSGSPCIDKAQAIAGLTDDIDDEGRATDIGGDEFDGVLLPVELLFFIARVNDKGHVDLKWRTASEINNDHFTVERIKNLVGLVWETVDIINGAGNSNSLLHYFSTDNDPYTGTSYYRLKQTDFDGALEYSDIVVVKISGDDDLVIVNIIPNPNKGKFFVEIESLQNEKYNITVENIYGQLIYFQSHINASGINVEYIELPEYLNGIYLLKVSTRTDELIKKIVVY